MSEINDAVLPGCRYGPVYRLCADSGRVVWWVVSNDVCWCTRHALALAAVSRQQSVIGYSCCSCCSGRVRLHKTSVYCRSFTSCITYNVLSLQCTAYRLRQHNSLKFQHIVVNSWIKDVCSSHRTMQTMRRILFIVWLCALTLAGTYSTVLDASCSYSLTSIADFK